MDANVLTIIVSVVALMIAAYAIWKAQKPVTLEGVTTALAVATPQAQELAEVALTAAQAAQQLYHTGKIAKSERLDFAFNYVKKWFPGIDQATIITAIEAGVLITNSIVDALPKKDTFTGGQP